jgi:hypothetical protein
MPPQTNMVPGKTGSTVPAKPNKTKAADNIHNKVISKINPRGRNKLHTVSHMDLSRDPSG